ncbi:uncharacterized protein N7500_007049 [Penicillium coprophilum]|uniref:uncharacterized protein n=1 Tax=Penicillium coprophilum TaxID=36646 RepID=UPI0023975913|nr:uncharacterized protein N7500_007049 [Penicillium coprophilum]KAJ5165219.1 hypothetical protein N7500_007049 [Penicillium coprophilum]
MEPPRPRLSHDFQGLDGPFEGYRPHTWADESEPKKADVTKTAGGGICDWLQVVMKSRGSLGSSQPAASAIT